MKFLLTIWLLLILVPSPAVAQLIGGQQASLTRELIRKAERRLSDMGYWTGAVDGVLDPATRAALAAFQKWEGRAITGRLTIDEVEVIGASAGPKARELGYEHVERIVRYCCWSTAKVASEFFLSRRAPASHLCTKVRRA